MKKKEVKLSAYLKECRVDAGLTQLEAALKLGYSNAQFISNWERGVSSPPLKVLRKLIKLYGVRPEEIMDILVSEHVRHLRQTLKLQA